MFPLRPRRKAYYKEGHPISIRLNESLRQAIRSEAERTGAPLSWVIRDLLEIAVRMQRFPGVVFLEDAIGRRAYLAGTGLEIWEVIDLLEQHGSASALSERLPRPPAAFVQNAAAYAQTYAVEVEAFREMHRRIRG